MKYRFGNAHRDQAVRCALEKRVGRFDFGSGRRMPWAALDDRRVRSRPLSGQRILSTNAGSAG